MKSAVAQQHGYQGNICLPLRDATHTFGVLVMYAAEVHRTSAHGSGCCRKWPSTQDYDSRGQPMKSASAPASVTGLLTGIRGFDEITGGGLPRGPGR